MITLAATVDLLPVDCLYRIYLSSSCLGGGVARHQPHRLSTTSFLGALGDGHVVMGANGRGLVGMAGSRVRRTVCSLVV